MIERREVNDANAIVAGKSLGLIQIYKWLLTLPTKTCKTVNVSFSHWELGEENDSEHVLKSVNMMILLPIYICLNSKIIGLERQADPPQSCCYFVFLSLQRSISLMATDLFVFSLKPLMILESETRKRRGGGINRAKETEGTRE